MGAEMHTVQRTVRNEALASVVAPGTIDPVEISEHHAGIWTSIWRAYRPQEIEEAMEAVRELREQMLSHPSHGSSLELITPGAIRHARRAFGRGRASVRMPRHFKTSSKHPMSD